MPTVKFDENSKTIYLNNSFLKSSLRYIELEKGLWLFNTKIFYKNSVMYEAFYDNSIPADYYCLTINLIQNEYSSEYYKFGSHIISNYSINFLKPHKKVNDLHFKNSTEKQYVVHFSEDWMNQNILKSQNIPKKILQLLDDGNVDFATFSISKAGFEKIISDFELLFKEGEILDTFKIKLQTYQFFEHFFASFDKLQSLYPDRISVKDTALFEKIEHHLMASIYGKFPGIDVLSNEFKVSPTKLKKDFKIIYGASIFSYFQNKQMELAYQILEEKDLKIKEVAALFGYENVSKFTVAFKKFHKVLPSKMNLP